jgi:glucosamine--fructose-6-phosphate aminotransferase (isomerizing)
MNSSNTEIRDSATLTEIMSQPETWRNVLQDLSASSVFDGIWAQTAERSTWLFVGCGTSYYLAEAAAASRRLQTGRAAFAVPASEIMLFPDTALLHAPSLQAVIISRSGQTSEALRAAELLRRQHKVPTLGITCGTRTPLEAATDLCLSLHSANDQSPVMTRSFTSMLMSLQLLAARSSGDPKLPGELAAVAARCASRIESWARSVEEFVTKRNFAAYAFLGQGAFYGIAREAALKVTEMSCSFGQPFHTLEFRHGPKAIVTAETCLTFFLSETGSEAERKVLVDMKELGGTVVAVCNRADRQIRSNSDLVFELEADVRELAMLAAFVVPVQLIGFHTGVKKGLTPDNPRNLTRVVLLD